VRAWLYRIATNRCLNALRARSRRPREVQAMNEPPEPTRRTEPIWVEPYPDVLLEDLPDRSPGPAARYEARETIELGFIAALQRLPAADRDRAPRPNSARERQLVGRFADAVQSGDIDDLLALLTDDALLTMPPQPLEYQGHEPIAAFLRHRAELRGAPLRVVPTRANTQPAFGCYLPDAQAAIARPYGLIVLTLEGDAIAAITWFADTGVFRHFGLPRTLPNP
jgi:RNA polymerase sigma-70 factor (ECF subfamily)